MKRLLTALLFLPVLGQASAQVSFGHAERLNDGWRFLRVDSSSNVNENSAMKEAGFDDSRWRRVTLPHDWGVELPMSPDKGSCQGYLPGGIGWYRKKIDVKSEGVRTYLYFEGVYNYSEVYLNGHLLGRRPSGFASFLYDLTPYLKNENENQNENGNGNQNGNVIAVRVDHSHEADSRWYTGSGIYRDVWLVTAPEVHLAQWGTAYRLVSISNAKAELEVDVETTDDRSVKSPMTLKAEVVLSDAQGRVVATATTTIGTQQKKTLRLTVKNPQRWTLDKPYLYTLRTILLPPSTPNLQRSTFNVQPDTSTVRAGLRTLDSHLPEQQVTIPFHR